jgi:hypothetical protein
MRGFNQKPSKQVTFTRGEEAVTYTVHALPALFMAMVRQVLPYSGDKDDPTLEMRALIMTAEGLRPTEQIPPHPDPGEPAESWRAYAHTIASMFSIAGLTLTQINKLGLTVSELDSFVSDELETVGND